MLRSQVMKDNRGAMKPTARKMNGGGPQMMMNDWQMNQPQAMACNTNHVVPVVGFPRSAFEAVHDESSKFRQLPCRTLISVGVCPYREKCVFLHDPRCVSVNAKSITRLKNKNKDDCIADSLYWPAMPRSMVMQYPENEHHHHQEEAQPHTVQPYCVPVPQQDQYHLHDAAVYSMWMHFVDFCLATASPSATADSAMCYAAVDVASNPYARSKRLPVFRSLCRGSHVTPLPSGREDFNHRRAEYGLPPSYQQQTAQQVQQHQVPLAYSQQQQQQFQATPAPAALSVAHAPLPVKAQAPSPAPSSLFGPSVLLRGANDLSSSLMTSVSAPVAVPAARPANPASPAMLVRRQSASSPVSITDANAIEYDLNDALGLEGLTVDADELVDALDLNDCGLGLLGSEFSASSNNTSSALQKQNLPQVNISPLLLQSMF